MSFIKISSIRLRDYKIIKTSRLLKTHSQGKEILRVFPSLILLPKMQFYFHLCQINVIANF